MGFSHKGILMYQTQLGSIVDPIERFFAIAKERQSIYLKKEEGLPRPWTDDAILNNFKFTNVYREQDKTTKWFRENVREELRKKPEVLLATVLFRWFNRIEIGNLIFCYSEQGMEGATIWDDFRISGNGKSLEEWIRLFCPKGPWVTGAYLITSKPGMDKLAGMCNIAEDFYHNRGTDVDWQEVAHDCLDCPGNITLESVWSWLKKIPFQGPFHAYEVVTDLRHTALLDQAPDINTWANAGPGAQRGLARIHGRPLNSRVSAKQACEEMVQLLEYSRDTRYWPNNDKYPTLELREIEHTLCEVDKYCRVYESNGKKKPRSIYR